MSDLSEDPNERARKYLMSFEIAIGKFAPAVEDTMVREHGIRRVSDAITRYFYDARFYLADGKPVTALASIAYAEGLLDALSFLGLAKTDIVR